MDCNRLQIGDWISLNLVKTKNKKIQRINKLIINNADIEGWSSVDTVTSRLKYWQIFLATFITNQWLDNYTKKII